MERKKAAALKYERGKMRAPRVVAKGEGVVAEKIVEIARRSGVPVLQNRGLVEFLLQVDLGAEIPPELYRAVAELLAYVYRVTGKGPKGREAP
ncbi:EscU/YscU/HrcU family type III secretion system export apparatus switch protein [Thermovibrio ammonificans]|jgi:flagellar biosynthesis protein|uniref:Type III secretion exporter n=1 Tax=Thermovibrio ammonificans (strain DSM 15698 / JCM 12110 / HB-1) TaxID=648996 RepID=E8T5K0_THEA1|nr:EscU/YscU/HrcU family type III secretion system export apparatus switch protein [Thermovibrio ammonificans]ADU96475.1 type III secretion exporter [Thermovibrio ammonificans HB-1]